MQLDSLIEVALVPIVVPLVLAGLSRAGALAAVSPGELRYARALRWFSLALAVVPSLGFFTIFMLQSRPLRPDERVALVLLVMFFPVLAAPVVLEFFRVRHRFDDLGVAFGSPWTRHRHVAWADVTQVRWRKMLKWLDLRTTGGTIVHISPWLTGLPRFADLALRRIPPATLAACPEGRAVLRVMSAGAASSLMLSPLTPEKLLDTLRTRVGPPA